METAICKSVTASSPECVVRIRGGRGHSLNGTVSNTYYGKTFQFNNELEFLAAVTGLLNDLGFPQEAFECRSFFKSGKGHEYVRRASETMEDNVIHMDEDRATFVVNVQFRQNASWQGNVTWVEKEQTRYFRSVLELLTLMGESQGGKEIVSWDKDNKVD